MEVTAKDLARYIDHTLLKAEATAADIEKWNMLAYRPVDYTTLEEEEDITELKHTVACAGGTCEIV